MTPPTSLPKVELHCHLDCSIGYPAASRILPGLSQTIYDRDYILTETCRDLSDFLSRVPRSLDLLQEAQHLSWTAEDLGRQLHEDHVFYAEVRFAPLLHTQKGLTPHEIIGSVLNGMKQAEATYGITMRLILCTLRHFSLEQSLDTAKLANDFKEHGVVGIDLAADEAGFPISPHIKAFEFAMDHDIPRTAHAGEALGPESVMETLDFLKPNRIGHGVRSIENPSVIQRLIDSNVHLEVCPGCNVQIGIYSHPTQHPVDQLYQKGVSLNINTDGRSLPQRTLAKEYHLMMETFQWDETHFNTTNQMALRAAFCDEATKENLFETAFAKTKNPDGV